MKDAVQGSAVFSVEFSVLELVSAVFLLSGQENRLCAGTAGTLRKRSRLSQ